MTIVRQLIVACDATECADEEVYIATADTYQDARAETQSIGWTVDRGRDYCPRHSGP